MGIIDTSGALNYVATSEPTLQTAGGYAEGAILADRSGITSPYASHVASWGQGFTYCLNALNLTTTNETAVISILNPTGSGKILKLGRICFIPPLGISGLLAVTATVITYRVYVGNTITANGTAQTIIGNRQTGQNAPASSIYLSPTVGTKGSQVLIRTVYSANPVDADHHFNFFRLLDPGQNLVISAQASAATVVASLTLEFSEMLV